MSQGGSKIQSNNVRSHASSGGRCVSGWQQDTIKQCKVWEWATREFFLKKGDSVVIDRFRFLFEYFSMAWVMKSVEIV